MATRPDPSALRWLIGVELANFRKQSTLTQADVTRATGIRKPKLSSMESGRYQQHPEEVATLLRLYGAEQRDIDRLTSLCGRSESRAWWAPWAHVIPDWLRTFVGLEGLAIAEFAYEPMVIPGLLQTEEYAQELTTATGFVRPDHSERFIQFRLARAERLTGPGPLKVHAVIGEAALRLKVGPPDLRKSQFQHLIRLSKRPNVTLQVIRPEEGPHAASTGSFAILDFEKVRSVAYSELLDGAMYIQDPDDVATYRMAAESVQRVALSPDDSVALINSVIEAG